MQNFNLEWFNKINGLAGKNKWLDAFGRAGAEWSIIATCGWFTASAVIYYLPDWIGALAPVITFSIAWLLAWTINIALGFFVREPRPQVSDPKTFELFRPLMHWKSFPSDHAMSAFLFFFFAVIFSLPGSWALLIFALWTSFGRVYSGVHYPIDILGGFSVSACIASWTALLLSIL